MPSAALDRLNLNYRLEGDGPETVVLINGLADDLETWSDQVPALLEAGYRVLRFDNRGIGLSDKPVGPYTTAMFAADTKALVEHLRIDNFHLLGVSMGGMIAQEYALAYPEDLRSLTLACTYAAPGPFCSRMFSFWADVVNVMGVSAVMRDVTVWAFTPEFFFAGNGGRVRAAYLTKLAALAGGEVIGPELLDQGQAILNAELVEAVVRHVHSHARPSCVWSSIPLAGSQTQP